MYKILSYYKDQEIEKNPINWINTMHDIKYSLVIRHLSMINPNLDIRIVEYVISKTDSDFHSRLKESVKNFYFAGEMQNIIDSKLPAKNLSMLTVTTSLSESCSTQSK